MCVTRHGLWDQHSSNRRKRTSHHHNHTVLEPQAYYLGGPDDFRPLANPDCNNPAVHGPDAAQIHIFTTLLYTLAVRRNPAAHTGQQLMPHHDGTSRSAESTAATLLQQGLLSLLHTWATSICDRVWPHYCCCCPCCCHCCCCWA